MSLKITATSKLYALFADPAIHSASPAMYNACFENLGIDAVYLAFTLGKDKIGQAMEAMRTLPIYGCNLSMPNKQCVIPYLDGVSDDASLAQAVNTVVNRQGKLYGYNTDIIGSSSAIEDMGVEIDKSRAVLIGLGGAGRAILIGLARKKVDRVSIFVRRRRKKEHEDFVEQVKKATGLSAEVLDIGNQDLMAKEIKESNLLINATDIGMTKDRDNESSDLPIGDISYIHEDLFIMDAVYAPEETALIRAGKKAGCRAVRNGRGMLFFQGKAAFSLFTGKDMPVAPVMKAWEGSNDQNR